MDNAAGLEYDEDTQVVITSTNQEEALFLG